MIHKKKVHPKVKSRLHPRNRHRERYDFNLLTESCPELDQYVKLNDYQDQSIDFFDPAAVKMLNKALLMHFYQIDFWDIPKGYLCPPIPGRADYIHHIADLLGRYFWNSNKENIPTGPKIKCLDIGVGASCVYPIIGFNEYGWSFVGADIDPIAIQSANKIIEMNTALKGKIEIRLQENPKDIFQGIIKKDERVDLTICNPPFHASEQEAKSSTIRKLKNLKGKNIRKPILNFGGQNIELWCEGGEAQFIHDMIHQSRQFSHSCYWFSTLISSESSLKNARKELKNVKPTEVKTISMGQGNKTSRILAWTFLNRAQQEKWVEG